MNLRSLFTKFRKKESNLTYSLKLIYLEDSRIVFNPNLAMAKLLEEYISDYLRIFNVYSDKPYVAVYQEYRHKYWIYDQEPYLLLYKVPLIVNQINKKEGINLQPITRVVYSNIMDILPEHDISENFKVPEYLVHLFKDLWSKCLGYMGSDHEDLESILKLMQHNWLKEFEYFVFKRSKDTDSMFLSHCLNYIVDQAEEESNKICIKNIIERNLKKND